ncbi:TOBE domain-containing protein [Oleidesulfovibrio sp.]|uniref:TOBE domain-containing protein n=1 Tax=Oleidesulfovibrio sp. TaxID=2909707 RepID=UPI003A8845E7
MASSDHTVRPSPAPRKGRSAHLAPHSLFTVPQGVKLLEAGQLMALERAFAAWRAEAGTAQAMVSRGRMWLLFQLLRHSGARLGEVQALHVQKDLSMQACTVRFGHNGKQRELPLPRALCREIERLLDGPAGTALGSLPFKVDQGYARRVFYARADEAGIPRDLANPRVIRNTRAVELLRSGVPLAVVREVLGQASADLTAVLQSYSSGDMRTIVRRLAMDAGERSSARNSFKGHVTGIRTDSIMAEVSFCTVGGHEISALITMESLRALELEEGSPVGATVKAPYVDVRLHWHASAAAPHSLRSPQEHMGDRRTQLATGLKESMPVVEQVWPDEASAMTTAGAQPSAFGGQSQPADSSAVAADLHGEVAFAYAAAPCAPDLSESRLPAFEPLKSVDGQPCSNRLSARITQVRSSGVMVEVMGACNDGTQLCALMAVSDAEQMGIASCDAGAGQDVAAAGVKDALAEFSFKPLSVVLHTV